MRAETEFEDLTAGERLEPKDHASLEPDTENTDSVVNERTETDTPDSVADAKIETLEQRVASLEAELDAVRGLLGGIDAVDEAVEQRVSIALAKVESLEHRVDEEDGLVRERLSEGRAEERPRPSVAANHRAGDATEPESPHAADDRGSLTTRLRDAFQ